VTSVLHLADAQGWRKSPGADPTLDLPLDFPGVPRQFKIAARNEAPALGDVLHDTLLYVGDAPLERRMAR
jgi:hypothetical protein